MEEGTKKHLSVHKIFHHPFWGWIFLFALTLFICSSRLLNADEGIVLDGAWNMINGKLLYINFFEFVPPANFYIIYWVWHLFGVSYVSAKIIALCFVFAACGGIYKIGRDLTKNNIALIPAIIFLILLSGQPTINYNTFQIALAIWSAYFFIKFLKEKSIWPLALSGFLAGVSFLFLQQKGLAIMFAELAFIIFLIFREKKLSQLKNATIYLIAFLVPLLVLLRWPIGLIWHNLIYYPFFNYIETNRLPLIGIYVSALIYLWLAWQIKNKGKEIWFLLLMGMVLLISAIPRPDIYHLSLILFPLFIFIIYGLNNIDFKKWKKINLYTYFVVCFIILYVSYLYATLMFTPPFTFPQKKALIELKNYIGENCKSQYVYFGPFASGLYFETRTSNPTAYDFLLWGQQTREQFQEAADAIEKAKPDCAVLDYGAVVKFNYSKNNPVDNYLMQNYILVKQIGRVQIYKISQ